MWNPILLVPSVQQCMAWELCQTLRTKIRQLEKSLLFWVLCKSMTRKARREERRLSCQSRHWHQVSSEPGHSFHKPQDLSDLGLAIAHELGTITLSGFVGFCSSGSQWGDWRSRMWGADLAKILDGTVSSTFLACHNTTSKTKSFLLESSEDGGAELAVPESKPLAELFLNATILFANIVGFTTWPSVREPTHVFHTHGKRLWWLQSHCLGALHPQG